MTDHHQEAFREETGELLADLESSLLELEERPEDPDLIGRVFRALHTIKGLGAMCGFDAVSAFTHQVESVFDRVRCGEVPVSRKLVTLSLAALDRIRTMLADGEAERSADERENAAVIAAFGEFLPLPDEGAPESLPAHPSAGSPLGDFFGVLTEYELSRLRANLHQHKELYALRAVFSLATLDTELAEITARIKREGELLSSVPDPIREEPESIAFRLLFASAQDPLILAESLGAMPERIAADGCFDIGAAGSAPPQPSETREVTYRIRFRPGPDILTAGLDPFALFADLRLLGACRIMAQTELIPPLPELEPAACFVYWDIILTTCRGEAAIRDVFFFVGDEGELRIEIADDGLGGASKEDAKPLGE
ncbi:MAG TPA: Hpt domain-containing protein, partial [Geobacteraceae bacterium]|nr:Hpt domain-containing protein [Geobacteraceae bacterium]